MSKKIASHIVLGEYGENSGQKLHKYGNDNLITGCQSRDGVTKNNEKPVKSRLAVF